MYFPKDTRNANSVNNQNLILITEIVPNEEKQLKLSMKVNMYLMICFTQK